MGYKFVVVDIGSIIRGCKEKMCRRILWFWFVWKMSLIKWRCLVFIYRVNRFIEYWSLEFNLVRFYLYFFGTVYFSSFSRFGGVVVGSGGAVLFGVLGLGVVRGGRWRGFVLSWL